MLPIEFQERMKSMLGDEYEAFLQGYDKPRFHALRRNPLKIGKEELLRPILRNKWKEKKKNFVGIKRINLFHRMKDKQARKSQSSYLQPLVRCCDWKQIGIELRT